MESADAPHEDDRHTGEEVRAAPRWSWTQYPHGKLRELVAAVIERTSIRISRKFSAGGGEIRTEETLGRWAKIVNGGGS